MSVGRSLPTLISHALTSLFNYDVPNQAGGVNGHQLQLRIFLVTYNGRFV